MESHCRSEDRLSAGPRPVLQSGQTLLDHSFRPLVYVPLGEAHLPRRARVSFALGQQDDRTGSSDHARRLGRFALKSQQRPQQNRPKHYL
jgi:hypothetical protein